MTSSWKKPFYTGSFFLFILLVLNTLATHLYLYSAYPWFDIPLHILGGFCVGLFSVGLIRFFGLKECLLYIIIGVISIGVMWEFVEVYFNVSILFGGNFWFDTIKDLCMDTLGGIISYVCFHQSKTKTTQI